MNLIDYGIVILILVFTLFGFYRGFLQSLLNLGGCLLSFVASFWLFPKLADAVSSNPKLYACCPAIQILDERSAIWTCPA